MIQKLLKKTTLHIINVFYEQHVSFNVKIMIILYLMNNWIMYAINLLYLIIH